jgi:hypothetical protein
LYSLNYLLSLFSFNLSYGQQESAFIKETPVVPGILTHICSQPSLLRGGKAMPALSAAAANAQH